MGLYVQNSAVTGVYVGNTLVTGVYVGDTKIWPVSQVIVNVPFPASTASLWQVTTGDTTVSNTASGIRTQKTGPTGGAVANSSLITPITVIIGRTYQFVMAIGPSTNPTSVVLSGASSLSQSGLQNSSTTFGTFVASTTQLDISVNMSAGTVGNASFIGSYSLTQLN